MIVFVSALALWCGCTGDDSQPSEARSSDAQSGDSRPTDAADDVAAPDVDTGRDSRGDASQEPDATPLPAPPERPEPFSLDCPVAEPSEALLAWLDDHPHCHGEGEAIFEDATLEAGLAHMHNVPAGHKLYEGLPGGGGVLEDLNNDGALDLYLSNADGTNRLLLNDGSGSFHDCTAQTGLGFAEDWTNGVSAADFDNDGWPDLYLANRGQDRLIRNNGDGTFTEVTEEAGISADGNSGAASWGDLDGDGLLELFVSTLAWTVEIQGDEMTKGKSHLFRNLGDGTFEEISDQLGLVPGSSFIAPMIDFDNDGDLDILFTQEFHEFARPQFFRNDGVDARGQLQFAQVYDGSSVPLTHAVMGVGVFDTNRDGLVDLAVSNLWGMWPYREALMENRGDMKFEDVAPERGAWALDSHYTEEGPNRLISWAIVPADIDNDADDDMYLTYGNFNPGVDFEATVQDYPPYAPGQPNALLLDDGDGQFAARDGSCAEDTGRSRAAIAGDVDSDGCLDLVVVNQDGAVRLLRNRCEQAGNHLSVELVGTTSNRDAIGARVEVTTSGRTHHRRIQTGSDSLHSSAPRRLHFGLGDTSRAEKVEVWWPSGARQVFRQVPAGAIALEEPAPD